jgi:hypothetical protein
MKRIFPHTDEFYVGYRNEAAPKTSRFIKALLAVVGVAMITTCIAIVLSQQGFSSGVFEYGQESAIEGYIFSEPIPHIKIQIGNDSIKKPKFQAILLVGAGKMGARETLQKFEHESEQLNGKRVVLKGYKIYGNNKALFQIDPANPPHLLEAMSFPPVVFRIEENLTVTGEIVDPKCYFGVMKPGEGKPHRSCAIRCLSGGIPPVFHSKDDYFLLIGDDFLPLNQEVLPIVGDLINLSGKVVNFDDWKILLINRAALNKATRLAQNKKNLLAFENGITLCAAN